MDPSYPPPQIQEVIEEEKQNPSIIVENPEAQNHQAPPNQVYHEGVQIAKFLQNIGDKETLYFTLQNLGYSLPSLTCVTTVWLIHLLILQLLPKTEQIKPAPPFVKATKSECIEIINRIAPQLDVNKRLNLSWLRDISYTLEPNNPCFAFDHSRASNKDTDNNGNFNVLIKNANIAIPNDLLNNVVQPKKGKSKKGNIRKSIKDLGNNGHINFLAPAIHAPSDPEIRNQLITRGVRKECVICLQNEQISTFTACCGVPMHRQCIEVLEKCPICKREGRPILSGVIQFAERSLRLPE